MKKEKNDMNYLIKINDERNNINGEKMDDLI
jgi:hypothetical protein